MRQAQTRRNGWRWLALAVGTLSALSLAEASMVRESEINQKGKARKLWDIEEGKGI